jgi:hypothetical protein
MEYPDSVQIKQHWWNGISTARGRRDVYIRSDDERWDVKVQIGGVDGRSRVQECPSGSAAEIVASAWLGTGRWKSMVLTPASRE